MSEVNKIANYNQMMSWLTRPSTPQTETREDFAIGGGQFQGQDMGTREGFSKYSGANYTKKLVTPSFLKASGTSLQDLTAAERKLFREGNLFYTKMKGKGGKAGTNFFGDSQKIDTLLGTVPNDISNLPDELSGKSVTAQKIRKRFIEEYLKELPKGDVINLDATTRILDERISEATNGKIRMKDKTALQNFLNDKKLNTNKVRGPKNVAEAKDIQMKAYPSIEKFDDVQKQADELNAKYKLDDKGIKFMARETSTGKVGMRLSFTGEPFRDASTTAGRSIDVAPTAEGISKLETELKKIIKTDAFKTYSAKEASRKGSIIAGAKKLKYNQPELFEYLLNKEGPVSKEQVIKDFKKFGYDEGVLRKAIGNLHANMYRALDPNQPGSGKFLSDNYNSNQIKNVLDKVKNNFAGDYFNRTFENLLIDAYGDVPKKYKPLADKLKKFRELQKELKKAGVGDEFIAQLDHVIPFNFLQLVREGKNPDELLRVRAYPGTLNSATFKGAIDGALGRAVENKDKKLIKTITELRDFLPEDMGKIDSTGKKVIDYGAEPFNLKTIYSDQQKKFGEVYKRTQEFMDNPKVINLLKDAGISLRAINQIKKLNVPGFLNTFKELKKSRPELFVGIDDEFADIENQYAGLNLEGDFRDFVARQEEKKKEPGLPAEAIGAGTLFGMKYAPQIAKGVGATVRAVGSPLAGLTLAGTELLSDDPSLGQAGAELLLPDQIKRVAGQLPKGIMSNVFGLQGLSKFGKLGALAARAPSIMTPVGLTLLGAEGIKKLYDEEQKKKRMIEAMDLEERLRFLEEEKDTEELMSRAAAAYGGRMGFADGPEDPKKRKFMKIMGGLASLPLLGRFIDIGTTAQKTAPVVAEAAKSVPPYFFKLVEKIRQLGDNITGRAATQDREIVKSYKDYEMSEDLATGEIVIRKRNEGVFYDQDGIISDEYMTYKPGVADETTKTRPIDEYDEYTVRPDSDGKLTDSEDGLDSIEEILEEAGDPDSMTLKK
jgi:hypothetical protein